MKLACEHYGKNFEGGHEKFCSNGCRHSHIASIEKKIREAVQSDPSHTNELSRK
ncbi:MAG: hypothetical protein ACQ9CV_06375 [Nitrosopumilus sp.]|jgi:hypothetical protein